MSLDLTKPVQTRDGRPVKILCTDMNDSQPVVGIVTYDGEDAIEQWCLDGRYFDVEGNASDCDLINVPQKHVKYLNVYRAWHGGVTLGYWDNKEQADTAASSDRLACVRVEFTEGQFDE